MAPTAKPQDLAREASANVLAGNPLPDQFGNPGVWHFYTEPDKGGAAVGPVIPAGSLLAKCANRVGAWNKNKRSPESDPKSC